ncbi:mismatched base pair and cruciform DNA recognition protein [Phellopilus nigrolimitatus]|nr:mismatched base pair and cruciform DNA recognition protein [Phellopilus nigrolimitatus]
MSSTDQNQGQNQSSQPNQTTGQYHSVKGNLVEAIGNATGAPTWTDSGRKEHDAGEAESNAARARDYAEGVADRVQGKFDAVKGALVDDKGQQISGNVQHDAGKQKQKINE